MFFFLPRACIGLLPIFQKKKFISRDKKNIFPPVFFCHPHYLFQIDSIFFYFFALINFFKKMSNVFFYLVALINFSKKRPRPLDLYVQCFFFSNVFFYSPPSLDFDFFSLILTLILYSSSTSFVEYQAGGGKGLVDLVNQLTLKRCHSFLI